MCFTFYYKNFKLSKDENFMFTTKILYAHQKYLKIIIQKHKSFNFKVFGTKNNEI